MTFMNRYDLVTARVSNGLLNMIPIFLGPKLGNFLTYSNHVGLQTLIHLYNKDHKQLTASLVHDVNKAF